MAQDISGFEYKVKFYNEAGMFLDSETFSIEVSETDDREADRDEASRQSYDWAEGLMDVYGAEEYEINLVNAY